jgi:serine/threonine protein kinase
MIATTLLAMLAVLINERAASGCFFAGKGDKNFDPIHEMIQKTIRNNKLKDLYLSARSRVENFDQSVKAICPSIEEEFIRKEKDLETGKIVGAGGTSLTFEYNIGGIPKVIKFIPIEYYFRKSISIFVKDLPEADLDDIIERLYLINIDLASRTNHDKTINFPDRQTLINKVKVMGMDKSFEKFKDTGLMAGLPRIFVRYFSDIEKEVLVNAELSKYSDENDKKGRRTFMKFDYCLMDADMNAYLMMDKPETDLYQVRKHCEQRLGYQSLSERLLFSIQLVYKAWKLNDLGYIHCDIREDNIGFENDSQFSWVYFLDFWVISNKKRCSGSNLNFSAPEVNLIEHVIPLDQKNRFGTLAVMLSDAFSLGLVLVFMEANSKDRADFAQKYREIKELRNFGKIRNEEKGFQNYLITILKKADNYYFPLAPIDPKENSQDRIFQLYSQVLSRLLDFDYNNRYSLSVALFLLHKIYELSLVNDTRTAETSPNVEGDVVGSKLRSVVWSPEEPFEFHVDEIVQAEGKWTALAPEFEKSVIKVEVLLGIRVASELI